MVRDWEQARVVPDHPAQALLRVIDVEPGMDTFASWARDCSAEPAPQITVGTYSA